MWTSWWLLPQMWSTTDTAEERNLQCLSEHDRTAVSQLHFFSCLLFSSRRQSGTHTHTHTHTRTHTHIHRHTYQHVCFQLLFLLTERWERQRELVKAVEMPHHFTHSVFLTISDLVYWCYFNIFPIILCCSRQLLPSPPFFSFLARWRIKERLLT